MDGSWSAVKNTRQHCYESARPSSYLAGDTTANRFQVLGLMEGESQCIPSKTPIPDTLVDNTTYIPVLNKLKKVKKQEHVLQVGSINAQTEGRCQRIILFKWLK